jgi:hypothetical protein
MYMKNLETLNEKQQKLIMQYADGCCGWLARCRAKSLLAKSMAAQDYLEGLQQTSSNLKTVFGAGGLVGNPTAKVDLWQRIEDRIEQEERAAFYI